MNYIAGGSFEMEGETSHSPHHLIPPTVLLAVNLALDTTHNTGYQALIISIRGCDERIQAGRYRVTDDQHSLFRDRENIRKNTARVKI